MIGKCGRLISRFSLYLRNTVSSAKIFKEETLVSYNSQSTYHHKDHSSAAPWDSQ